jgi:hypothetical protein
MPLERILCPIGATTIPSPSSLDEGLTSCPLFPILSIRFPWGDARKTLRRPPPAVRFQACDSNDCGHLDWSPSDLKPVKAPAWFHEGRGHPLLRLYSVVDDRCGVAYQEDQGVEARMAGCGVAYQVAPNLDGETVVRWWGLFDQDLDVEPGEHR